MGRERRVQTLVGVAVIAVAVSWAVVLSAQVPRTMSYQGALTDASGIPVADGTYTLAFRLYTTSSGGAAIFSEQQSVAVAKGVFSAIIGGVTIGGIPASVPFTGQYFLGISVNGAVELLPRTALTASPYALTSAALQLPAVQGASAATPLLSLTNSDAAGGDAIYGAHTATMGNGVGLRGETWSTGSLATGVFGVVRATGPSGANSAGVQGWHSGSGTGGAGVRGYQAGLGNGVEGWAPSGVAVAGYTTDGRAGVFQVSSIANASNALEAETGGVGSAGRFRVTNATSSAAALLGTTSGSGIGVSGSSSTWIGVKGVGASSTGVGVWGIHEATTGGNAGVVGQSNSTAGGVGVSGSGSGQGVGGYSLDGIGVLGSHQGGVGTNPGVRGQTYSTDAFATGVEGLVVSTAPGGGSAAVRGTNSGTGGSGIGVYGYQAGSGYGVQGESPSGRGVFGTSGSGPGVYGSSTSSIGVQGVSSSGIGVFGFSSNFYGVVATTAHPAYAALHANHIGAHALGGDIAVFTDDGVNRARIDKNGKGYFNGGTQTGGADLAEAFEVEGDRQTYEPGDVLAISTRRDRTLEKSSSAQSTLVAGVYATNPGILLSDLDIDAPTPQRVPLGVVGVIPTKVSAENGAIRRGDLLVTAATPGHAMKAGAMPAVGTVLGKALQDFMGPGTGVINLLVNVK